MFGNLSLKDVAHQSVLTTYLLYLHVAFSPSEKVTLSIFPSIEGHPYPLLQVPLPSPCSKETTPATFHRPSLPLCHPSPQFLLDLYCPQLFNSKLLTSLSFAPILLATQSQFTVALPTFSLPLPMKLSFYWTLNVIGHYSVPYLFLSTHWPHLCSYNRNRVHIL